MKHRWPWLLGGFAVLALLFILLWWTSWSVLGRDLILGDWANVATITGTVLAVLGVGKVAWDMNQARRATEAQQAAQEAQEVLVGEQRDFQRRAMIYQAWQAISGAQGKSGNGGRLAALEELLRNGESLIGVDVSGGAELIELALPGAYLVRANFQDADLAKANFECADLTQANLQGTNLTLAELQGTILVGANLREALVDPQSLQGANLSRADLRGARLMGDFSNSYCLTREQVLSARDWRGVTFPSDLKELELPGSAKEEEMDRVGRRWKPDSNTGH